MGVDNKIWQQAQNYEKVFHWKKSYQDAISYYREFYKGYFKYLGIETDQKGKRIIEVGPANVPALVFCENYGRSLIIEPMPSERLDRITQSMNVDIIKQPAENVKVSGYDQVWIFNLLQHVIDPEKLVENLKTMAEKIYFFEPINTKISVNHPHSLKIEDFKRWFGEASHYPFTSTKVFHTHECAYGIYENNRTANMEQ
jgi:hypothetical protein